MLGDDATTRARAEAHWVVKSDGSSSRVFVGSVGTFPCQKCASSSSRHAVITAGRDDVAKLLVRRGASVTARDAKGRTALDAAMDRGSIQDEELFLMLSSGPGVAFPRGA